MDFLLENALEIMYLCLGFGFLVLVFVVSRLLLTVHRTVKKVNYFTDSIEFYVKKPLQALAQLNDYVYPVVDFLGGKKK